MVQTGLSGHVGDHQTSLVALGKRVCYTAIGDAQPSDPQVSALEDSKCQKQGETGYVCSK